CRGWKRLPCPRVCPPSALPRVILLGLSPALPQSQKMCAQDQQVISSRVPDAVQRERQRSGAPLIRDRQRPERSRVCSASLHAAVRPGHERSEWCTDSTTGSVCSLSRLRGRVGEGVSLHV